MPQKTSNNARGHRQPVEFARHPDTGSPVDGLRFHKATGLYYRIEPKRPNEKRAKTCYYPQHGLKGVAYLRRAIFEHECHCKGLAPIPALEAIPIERPLPIYDTRVRDSLGGCLGDINGMDAMDGVGTSFREDPSMPALTTRREARARILAAVTAELDRLIPADETVPLKGETFADFEDQVERLARGTLPVILEERSALELNAQVVTGGRCPFCGSDRVYLEKQVSQPEVLSPHGPVVLRCQQARCRSCDGSFSPSGA